MMTGNTMKSIEAFLSSRYLDGMFYLSLIGVYTTATAVYRMISKVVPEDGGGEGRKVLLSTPRVLSPIVLLLFLLSDHYFPSPRPTLLLLSFAYGLINSASIESAGTITCMLTGHMHKLANGAVSGNVGGDKAQRRSIAVLTGFGGGVVL
eukprot:CAMPEP_0118648198 /NCGR_PEP_ID=MMETSP0785-20121206/9025_1 /TAXON_ID=91992 /ORGANISM="Bolidomonas pacifica, Strain CCMP 1866" /LENGTH=149 /DNA_ID=CAMNT_0006540369 /DNA_START=387 /DNA_END=832 /DNA_ORIENTATION=-